MTATQWDWWRAALAKQPVNTHDGQVESGFFRTKVGKTGGWLPVAIWRDTSGFYCRVGTKPKAAFWTEAKAAEQWTYVCKYPVSREDCLTAYETGTWPDGSPTTAPQQARSNAPSDPYEAWRAELDDKLEQVSAWLKSEVIDSKVKADRARNTQAELLALIKRGEGMHEVEKAPVLEQSRAIDGKYLPRCKTAKGVADSLRGAYSVFAAAEEARLRKEAAEKHAAEQKRIADENARIKAEREKLMEDDPIAAMTSPEPELLPEPAAPEPVKVNIGGGVGRSAGLKSTWVATVTDHTAALGHFAGHPDVVALVLKLAQAAVKTAKGDITIPGVAIEHKRIAQ